MSRRIVRAPLALTIDGAVLLNVAEFDARAAPDELVRTARAPRGPCSSA